MSRLTLLAILAALTGGGVRAALAQQSFPPPAERPRLEARRATARVSVDGRLDEADWAAAPAASGFRQIEPSQGDPAARDTEVRVLFDDQHVYVGVVLHGEPGGGLRVRDLRRDFAFGDNDAFGLVVDPFGTQRGSLVFATTPYGNQRDLQVLDGGLFDPDWNAVWRVSTTRSDSGWTAEFAIPWASLRYPAEARPWLINFFRKARQRNELSAWSPWPRAAAFFRLEYAGELVGIDPPRARERAVAVQPYMLGESAPRAPAQPMDLRTRVGLDLKVRTSATTVADLTVNTDFAQADVDRQVVNLTRFSVFFPERRPFFLENRGLFTVGMPEVLQPFFSRRLGLSTAGDPLPIDVGARVIHRSASRGAGLLAVRERDPARGTATLAGVARWEENIGRQNRVGALVTAREDDGPLGSRLTASASIDGFVRLSPRWQLSALASVSEGAGQRAGMAGFWALEHASNSFGAFLSQMYVGRDYDPRMGFVARPAAHQLSLNARFDWRPRWRPRAIRRFQPGWAASMVHEAGAWAFEEGRIAVEPVVVELQNGSIFRAGAEFNWQSLARPFTPIPAVAVTPGRYQFNRVLVAWNSDPSRWWTLRAYHKTGPYFDGRLATSRLGGSLAPTPFLGVAVGAELNRFRGVGNDATRLDAWLLDGEVRVAVSPRLQATAFYQYNQSAGAGALNMRLSWEFSPLSFLHVVYNDRNTFLPIGRPASTPVPVGQQQLVVKISHLIQR